MSQALRVKLMLDSGAFSAWRKGKPIDLREYCDFVKAHKDVIACCVALDVIDPSNPEYAARQSFDNWLYMRSVGIDARPVFHAREDLKWLDMMLDAGAHYIGLSASSIIDDGSVDP